MDRRTAGLGIAFVFVPALAGAISTAPIRGQDESAVDAYERAQIDLFDALRSDPSPRVQVLAGRLYFPEDDDDPAAALRPKRDDVVARAAALAPDDAFVQWAAADQGNYYSSQCGPTRWPEAEVANLVRLEPDNAGALQYAVALAQAKGDAAELDAALARLAGARRADDHFAAEIAGWTRIHRRHPADDPAREDASASTQPLLRALQTAGNRSWQVDSALESACKPDPNAEPSWQRLGWCVDAGSLLASKGSSFALRERGLKILAASGATKDDLADLQRQLDWLLANAATPSRNYGLYAESPDDLAADWKDAASEIAATERRLQRLGKPLAPPAGWIKDDDGSMQDAQDADPTRAWQDYVKSLVEELRGSGDARERALGLASDKLTGIFEQRGDDASSTTAREDSGLADLVAAHADDRLVQWIAAASIDDSDSPAKAAALANLQRLESDNAAAWALSLDAGDDAETILQRMAAGTRYDEHMAEIAQIWAAAAQRRPPPAETAQTMRELSEMEGLSDDQLAQSAAFVLASISSIGRAYVRLTPVCSATDVADTRKDACTAIGRLMLHSSQTLLAAMVGESFLRRLDALDARDRARARQIGWWHENSVELLQDGEARKAYFDDYLAGGNEIEVVRRAAARAGKSEPPAEWKSLAEKQAERTGKKPARGPSTPTG